MSREPEADPATRMLREAIENERKMREAAEALQSQLEHHPWLQWVRTGKVGETRELIVYASRYDRQVSRTVPEKWEEFPVSVRKILPPSR